MCAAACRRTYERLVLSDGGSDFIGQLCLNSATGQRPDSAERFWFYCFCLACTRLDVLNLMHFRLQITWVKTVLVADDSASMRLSMRIVLEALSAVTIHEAIDGFDAVQKAAAVKPDLILLDLAMPRLNGAEAASVLKKAMPGTPIILFTLHTDLSGETISSAIGVDAFVSKSEGFEALLARINAMLPSSQQNPK
jgi:CheY-like chemotaxis protein